jgi:cytochrome c-type biogenesis protein CcmH
MTPAIGFLLAAAGLVVLILAFILPPLLRRRTSSAEVDQRSTNLQILRDQLAELERERHEGSLAESDFEQARHELQRRLIEETQAEPSAASRPQSRTSALLVLLALPLLAVAGYALLGTPQALDPEQHKARVDVSQIEGMVNNLAARLRQNPDDPKGWIMLARSYKVLGRFGEAAEAYSHAEKMVNTEAALLADYAEVLVQASRGVFEGKPEDLLRRALAIDPDEPQALFLAGAAAIERHDFKIAVQHWQRLLLQLQPGSEEALALGEAVERAREASTRTPEKTGKSPK